MAALNILVVEDNRDLAANIVDYLEERGHRVDAAPDGVAGLRLAAAGDFDVIVLDLTLPRMDGLTLCRRLRGEAGKPTPVLILTARGTLDDKAAGFDCGADDYVVKPFELRELEMRLHALARRTRAGEGLRLLQVADLSFDLAALRVRRGERAIELPAIPLRILELLMKRSPQVVWRREIEQAVWGDSPPDSDALRVHIHTLRAAIDPPGAAPLLHTLRGVGYRLAEDERGPA
ncbi:MAG TPA: response regulator transcription factor [Rhodocyclaceae bacterium]|nr:response regulator transcription factor [Rhodocyclaceae bacterium]